MISKAVAAADGVPFFLEQLVISLIEEQSQGPSPHRRLGGVPLMLAQLMSERLDRRPGRAASRRRRRASAAPSPGTFCSHCSRTRRGQVQERLEALVEAEILRPRRYGAEVRYEFRHGLLQRMAHESMLHTERRRMHVRIAEVLRKRKEPNRRSWKHSPIICPKRVRLTEAISAWLRAGLSAAKRFGACRGDRAYPARARPAGPDSRSRVTAAIRAAIFRRR